MDLSKLFKLFSIDRKIISYAYAIEGACLLIMHIRLPAELYATIVKSFYVLFCANIN